MRAFDITRLTKRADAQGPSGVDRVDLAYLQWLRKSGPVDYLVNGIAGFTQIDRRLGNAFAERLDAYWQGKKKALSPRQLHPFRDSAQRLRVAGKWRARRAGLKELQSIASLKTLCEERFTDLDLFDTSAGTASYRVDRGWRKGGHRGCFFGISHSLLGRTAYLSALARHEQLKRVLFIHDTIPCDYPEYCREHEGAKHLLRIRNTFRYATHVVVNSEYTRKRLESWRRLLRCPEVPVEVIPIGVDGNLEPFTHYDPALFPPERPYFVTLGTIEPRKNHALLLNLWRDFRARLPADRIPKLLIIGRRGWENENIFRMLDRCEALDGHVQEMSGVLDDELWPLLRGARAMLFPSFVEGWGMPMVEALTLGVPVIGSKIDAFEEAGAGIPELISPMDGSLWAERILDYAQESSIGRNAQLEHIARYRPPTWEQHFAALEAFIGSDALHVSHQD